MVKDGEEKYETAKQSLRRARDSTEQLYDDARDSAERGVQETRGGLEQASREAKEGWFNLKGWGKSKSEEGEKKVEDVQGRLNKDN